MAKKEDAVGYRSPITGGIFYVVRKRRSRPGTKQTEKYYYGRFTRDDKRREVLLGRQYLDGLTLAKAKTELCDIREGRKLPPIEQKKANRLKAIEDAKNTIGGVWEACGNKVLDKGKNKGKQLKDVPSWSTTNGRYTNHVRPFFSSDFPVTQLDQEKVDAFKDYVLQLGLADQTKSHIIQILIKIIKKAGLNLELKNISVSSMTTEALSEEQERRLLAVADKSRPQTRRIFYFFYHSGCRRNELVGLRWENVDITGRTITFMNTKNGTDFTLPMSPELKKILVQQAGGIVHISGFVFPGENGKRRHPIGVSQIMRSLFDRADIGNEFRPIHGLRHHFAGRKLKEGVKPAVISKLLNHKSISQMDRYLTDMWELMKEGMGIG